MVVLSNQVVVITGGAGLIGKGVAKATIENGGIAVIADIDPLSGEKAVSEINSQRCFFVKLDVTDRANITQAIQQIHDQYGRIDTLINNAYPRTASWGKNDFYHFDFEDFCENLRLQLGGYVLTSQCFTQYFKKQGYGNIISMSSIMGVYAPKFENYEGTDMDSVIDYSIIKAGINHMTRWMAKYLANTGIRVNAIAPGGIYNAQFPQPQSFLEKYRKCCTSKGMLDPQDLIGSVVFLASDWSKYINGQILVVDDGWGL